jgi:hypothetical protein
MDSIDECDEDEHDHHVESSNTSFNVNLLTTMQVSNSTNYEKKKNQRQTNVNSHKFIIHNAHFNRMQNKKTKEE